MPEHIRFGLLRVRSPLLTQSLLFSFPVGNEMFQFPTFAFPCGNDTFPDIGLPHSEIRGSCGYLHLTPAFRSLSRPSSPPRAKASTVCPAFACFLLLPLNPLKGTGGINLLLYLLLFFIPVCQRPSCFCGEYRIRTDDPLLAGQVL